MRGHNAVPECCDVNSAGVLARRRRRLAAPWDYRTGHNFQRLETVAQPGSLACEAGIWCAFDRSARGSSRREADKTVKIWKEQAERTRRTTRSTWSPGRRSRRRRRGFLSALAERGRNDVGFLKSRSRTADVFVFSLERLLSFPGLSLPTSAPLPTPWRHAQVRAGLPRAGEAALHTALHGAQTRAGSFRGL